MALEIPDAHFVTPPETQEPTDGPKYSQKFFLQRRDQNGCFKKMETFDREISPEEALAKFGPGYYVLKSCLPRLKTVWKQKLGENEQSKELGDLKKRTTHLTCGVVGLGRPAVLQDDKFLWDLREASRLLPTEILQSMRCTDGLAHEVRCNPLCYWRLCSLRFSYAWASGLLPELRYTASHSNIIHVETRS